MEQVDLKLGASEIHWGLISERTTKNGLKVMFKPEMQVDASVWYYYVKQDIISEISLRIAP